MRCLVLDTALHACTAALATSDGDRAELVAGESRPMRVGHAEALMPMVAPLLQDHALPDRIVTTVGPGSFTGLRVALSAARGLALALRVPAFGVGTLAALAEDARMETHDRPVVAVLDARRDQVYVQAFAAEGAPLTAPALVPLADAIARARAAGAGAVLIGSGAELLAPHVDASAVLTPVSPSARALARLGARADAEASPPSPLYLRGPDAKMPFPSRLKAA
ncbi:MAG: tRNA (adenosine(37)-N6)-threonylcarbamoyltransferase complex dimerization subunit type 1 TsaB [Pseudomonadota bacterium]